MCEIKIAGIISSSKYNGNTAALVREALKGAESKGATITEIFLPQYKIEYCKGCLACLATGKCHISDDFENLRSMLRDTNGFVLSSPTYAYSSSAIFKTFLDRLGMFEYYTSFVFGGKYVAGISTAGRMGADKVAKEIAGHVTCSVFKRGYVSGSLAINVGRQEASGNTAALKKARDLGEKLVTDINQKVQYPFQNLYNRMICRFILQPLFLKNILNEKDGKMKGVYSELKNKGLIQ